jgi:hypothetical protein
MAGSKNQKILSKCILSMMIFDDLFPTHAQNPVIRSAKNRTFYDFFLHMHRSVLTYILGKEINKNIILKLRNNEKAW